ncbi:hypothetical protein SDC9_67358 [bioreactor metagenome]|uniref:Uncharacterized protein n=1 Tax=bioreactor metagenome TaxID=1076179 RepID=A0A644XXI1_9ZZZZ
MFKLIHSDRIKTNNLMRHLRIKSSLILGLVFLFLLSSCSVFRKPVKDENSPQDDKKSNRKHKEPKVMCYF